MAFAVTDFKSGLVKGGARPSLFSVEFSYPSPIEPHKIGTHNSSELLVKTTTIPASTIGTYDVYYHGKTVKVAGDRTSDLTWETTIVNDEDFAIRSRLEDWMLLISDTLNTRSKKWTGTSAKLEGENAAYKQDLKVKQYGKNGKVVRAYEFKGAFPTAIAAINLDWGTQEIEEFSCTWTYSKWIATDGTSN